MTVLGELTRTRCLAENPLAPVAVHRIPKPFSCNEGDPTRVAFVATQDGNAHKSMPVSPAVGEDLLKFSSGFDGLH